jgi:hypothetical protein
MAEATSVATLTSPTTLPARCSRIINSTCVASFTFLPLACTPYLAVKACAVSTILPVTA